MKRSFCRTATTLLSGAAFTLGADAALAVDAQALDFVPPPAGTRLGMLYYLHGSSDTLVDGSGDEVPGSELDTNVGVARYISFFDIGSMRTGINVVQPFGGLSDMSIGGRTQASDEFGLGDTSIVATFWLVNEPERNLYFSVANYLTLPTGDYDPDVASLGSNRWSGAVQPALHYGFAPRWSVELMGDVTIYGDNDDGPGGVTIKKDPSFTAIGWLNYHVSGVTVLSVGVSTTWGGKETWGGIDHGDSRVSTPRATWSQMLNPTTQLLLEVGTDVNAENTFERKFETVLRLAKVF